MASPADRRRPLRIMLVLVALGMAGTARAQPLVVAPPVNETGHRQGAAMARAFHAALGAALAAQGHGRAPVHRLPPEGLELRTRLLGCDTAADATPWTAGCRAVLAVHDLGAGRVLFHAMVRAPTQDGLAAVVAARVARGLAPTSPPATDGAEITARGMVVRLAGGSMLRAGARLLDLAALRHGHDPARDPDVPVLTDVTLPDPPRPDREAWITLYHIDPPLTGLPSNEPGIDRGIDFRDPARLVQSAATNGLSPVFTDEPVPVRVPIHPIGHFLVRVEIPGLPTLLTGMTTLVRGDAELLELTLGRQLGIGGVLLTPQPGRLNTAAEASRELALRQRRLRVIDGLHTRSLAGVNIGPEHVVEHGLVTFARFRLSPRNAADALAYFAEFVARGGHERFGSLLNRPFRGTGAGCAAFAMGWLQAAGVVPFIAEPAPAPPPEAPETLGPETMWRAVHAALELPHAHLGCDERVGAPGVLPARFTVEDLLFHRENSLTLRRRTEGLTTRLRQSFGVVPSTLFQLGAFTPLPELILAVRRKDLLDLGDYSWSGPGLRLAYWDNSRFSAWIRRLWEVGPRDQRVRLVREGRFRGVEVDATGLARQGEAFFAAADHREARLGDPSARPPAASCLAVFLQGLE